MTRLETSSGTDHGSGTDQVATDLARWVWSYASSERRGLLLLALLVIPETILAAAAPWPMKIVIDQVLAGKPAPAWAAPLLSSFAGAPLTVALVCIGGTIAFFLLGSALTIVHTSLSVGVGQRMVFTLAGELFAHMQRLSLKFHARKSIGDSMRRLTADCACVATIVRDCTLPLLGAGLMLAVMFAVMFAMNWPLALTAAAVLPLLAWCVARYSGRIDDRAYEYAEAEGNVYDIAERTLTSMPLVQSFTLEPMMNGRMRDGLAAVLRTHTRSIAAQFGLKILTGLALALGSAGILLMGTREVLAGKLSLGDLIVFLAYVGSVYNPLETVVQAIGSIREAAAGARRVREILCLDEEVKDSPHARPIVFAGAPEISFERVAFAYNTGANVLRDVSITIKAGTTLAVVGATGAGKSTLASLLPRLYDATAGRVCINAVDVRDITLRSLREQIAVVPQDTYLFPASVIHNISYGKPDATRREIEEAAKLASAHEFVSALPRGYETILGERGASLSVGQRQRIAIARALLKNAPILILDEPTAALDARTEADLLGALRLLRANRTTLVIAHRLTTIRDADNILVLSGGRVIESGMHESLLAAGGEYAALYHHQFADPTVIISKEAGTP